MEPHRCVWTHERGSNIFAIANAVHESCAALLVTQPVVQEKNDTLLALVDKLCKRPLWALHSVVESVSAKVLSCEEKQHNKTASEFMILGVSCSY